MTDKRTPTIADRYADLLSTLSERQRRSIVLRLTVGFYEGWNPSRGEIADLVAEQLGWLTPEEALQRQRQRKADERIPDFTPRVLAARCTIRISGCLIVRRWWRGTGSRPLPRKRDRARGDGSGPGQAVVGAEDHQVNPVGQAEFGQQVPDVALLRCFPRGTAFARSPGSTAPRRPVAGRTAPGS